MDCKIHFVNIVVVQDVAFFVVDKNVEVRKLRRLVGTKADFHHFSALEDTVDKLRVPFIAGRGRDADRCDAVTAVVCKRYVDRLFFFSAAGQKQRTQHAAERSCQHFLDTVHVLPP